MFVSVNNYQLVMRAFIFLVTQPWLAAGGRYDLSTPAELARVVVPLVIVGIIFIVMLVLLAVFQYKRRHMLCSCLCCRELCNKHTRMRTSSANVKCACITSNTTKPDTMCDTCKRWKNSTSGLLTRTDSQDISSDGTSSPEVRICQCTINNGCGSVLCKVNNTHLINEKLRAMELNPSKCLSTEEFLQTAMLNEECNCPCTMGKQLKLPTEEHFNLTFNSGSGNPETEHTTTPVDRECQVADSSDLNVNVSDKVLTSFSQGQNCHCRSAKSLDSE